MIPRRSAIAWHAVLLALFLAATAWAADQALTGWAQQRGVGRLVVPVLATLGFVSLSLREVRFLRRLMRRHEPESPERAA